MFWTVVLAVQTDGKVWGFFFGFFFVLFSLEVIENLLLNYLRPVSTGLPKSVPRVAVSFVSTNFQLNFEF